MNDAARRSEWIIHEERIIDDSRRAVLSIAAVELPDGGRFEQYVLRLPAAVVVVVLDGHDRVLMMRRHRFILDRWVWELPGGYVDAKEDLVACAVREVEEETGWRPSTVEHLVTVQPAVGTMDQPNHVFLARGADQVSSSPDINEAQAVAWVPLSQARQRMASGEIVGAGSVTGLLAVLLGM